MAHVLVLGATAVDTVVRVPAFPKTDDIVFPNEVLRVPGGSAANVAVALARLGAAASFLGTVGADSDGETIRAAFLSERVDASRLISLPNGRTAGAFIAVNAKGERVMYSLGGDAVYTDVSQLAGVDFACDALYIAEAFTEVGLESAARAKAHGAKVFFAPGGVMCGFGLDELLPLIKEADAVLLSEPELETLTGKTEAQLGADALFASGAKAIVVTQGSRGASLFQPHGVVSVPAAKATVVDTTGAGDAFAGAYLFSELRGDVPKERLVFASRCAAFACSRVGARTSPRLEEI
ncbi:MAG: carbohydrate kinase family protein [Clostridiaceae bacterium]